jgi:hypothetical protein
MIFRIVFAAMTACSLLWRPQPATAAQTYCPSLAHATPAKVPTGLVSAVAKTFQIDEAAARDTGFVRCSSAKLLACTVGANLNCDKADTRRALPGAMAWCKANPGSQIVPMSATGHDTIYEWSCKGTRAVAGKTVMHVDRRGYVAENWKEVQ